jgi:hypothetical protein
MRFKEIDHLLWVLHYYSYNQVYRRKHNHCGRMSSHLLIELGQADSLAPINLWQMHIYSPLIIIIYKNILTINSK